MTNKMTDHKQIQQTERQTEQEMTDRMAER